MSTVNTSARSSYHHGDLRAALVRLATAKTAQGGPESVSLREIAREAAVSSSAAYRHFSSKDELLQAVQQVVLEALSERMQRALEGSGSTDPFHRLRASGRAYVRFAIEEPMLFRSMSSGFPLPEGTWAGSPLGDLLDLVRAALPDHDEQEVTEQSVALWSMVHGFAILCTQGALKDIEAAGQEHLLEAALDLAIRGLHES